MFKSRSVLISLVAAAACLALTAQAADGMFTAAMDGAQCLPDPIKTPATGTVELRLSADGRKIDYKITLDKLSNPSQADLHSGAASQNGQAVVKLWPLGNAAAKRGEFSGVLAEGSFDASDFTGPMTGAPMSDLLEEIRAGNTYVNVHTYDGMDPPYSGPGDYRVGEIRGQLK
ncbi:MAG: CHRD domain-containing protein [Proteobacteria bacterium]|nr:CHRD domain-containing protein [Pseudomonadota bacterium]